MAPGDNQIKAIRTRNGHTIEIHDEGEGGYIRIYDNGKENYILTFSTDEKLIRLESTGNIELYAQNDIIMHAGHDITATADNDITTSAGRNINETAGVDRNLMVGRNDSITVAANQFVAVGDNKDENIRHKFQLSSENIRIEAQRNFQEYSLDHAIHALGNVSITSMGTTSIKGEIVKTN